MKDARDFPVVSGDRGTTTIVRLSEAGCKNLACTGRPYIQLAIAKRRGPLDLARCFRYNNTILFIAKEMLIK